MTKIFRHLACGKILYKVVKFGTLIQTFLIFLKSFKPSSEQLYYSFEPVTLDTKCAPVSLEHAEFGAPVIF